MQRSTRCIISFFDKFSLEDSSEEDEVVVELESSSLSESDEDEDEEELLLLLPELVDSSVDF